MDNMPVKNRVFTYYLFIAVALLMLCQACSADSEPPSPSDDGYRSIVLKVSLGSADDATAAQSRGAFDNFDNELDKWGIPGENMETLRIIIINGDDVVEHNRTYTLSDATEAGEYTFRVKDDDDKTIVIIANEEGYFIDEDGMEIAGGTTSLHNSLEAMSQGTSVDMERLRRMTLTLRHNSADGTGRSFRTPLPIADIFTEHIDKDTELIERDYAMPRAAVKYSFRIVNESRFAHRLEKLRIDRIADREYLFPDADYVVNSYGHREVSAYRTPATAREQYYEIELATPLTLPAHMESAVTALPAPVYVPEGLAGDAPQRMSLALDGEPLDVWRDLLWLMPGETEASPRPMVDLPRNTHVVVNITITDTDISVEADVQPYAEVKVDPWFGLDRDEDGNIITARHPDGTYDVIVGGEKISRDSVGDRILSRFTDGSILCRQEVKLDYIHSGDKNLYTYTFEKHCPNGAMVLVREISNGGVHNLEVIPEHDHGTDDRPLFVQDTVGRYMRAVYRPGSNVPRLTTRDVHNDSIIQANGFQFRQYPSQMRQYYGTYIVLLEDGVTEELRSCRDGRSLDWKLGTATPATSRAVQVYPYDPVRAAWLREQGIRARSKFINRSRK